VSEDDDRLRRRPALLAEDPRVERGLTLLTMEVQERHARATESESGSWRSSSQAAIAQLAEVEWIRSRKRTRTRRRRWDPKCSPASRPHEVKAPSFSSLILAVPGPSVMKRAGGGSSARSLGRLRPDRSAPSFEALRRSVA